MYDFKEPNLSAFLGECDEPENINIGINNPYHDKKHLTIEEALDLINHVSMELMINERNRRHK